MVADADAGNSVDPMEDAEAWQSLSRDEQSDILDEGVQDLRGERGSGAFRHLSDAEQAATIRSIERDGGPPKELSETERAMQEALDQTWQAEVFADLDDVPTVPFECRELSSSEQTLLQEAGQALLQIESAIGDLEDVDEEEMEEVDFESISSDLAFEHFDSVGEIETWIPKFLAEVTTDPGFDADRFRTGERMRPNTRRLLFIEIFLRYQEEAERAIKFRAE